jgi:hypothetical protein
MACAPDVNLDSLHNLYRRHRSGSFVKIGNLRIWVVARLSDVALQFLRCEFSGSFPGENLLAYDTRAAVIGDYGRTNPLARGTANLVGSWSPDLIITTGDNNYPSGTSATIDQNIGQFYQAFIGNYQGTFGAGSAQNRFFPVLGNHDWMVRGATPFLDYFTLPGNERYYDFVSGPIHFFAIDSDPHEPDGVTPSSVQGQWLKDALAASTSPFNVVYFHHPPYSSGDHGSSARMRWPFKDWGADVVISGHDHDYERLVQEGLLYIVNGSGAGNRSIGKGIRGSVFRNASDSGALLIQANDQAITFQFQLRSGKVIDTHTLRTA